MTIRLSRRQFLGASSAIAGSLVVGFHVPFARVASAQGAARPEINAWVVVQPDDIVVIRIARSEMGQGTLTGLAQLVAEELDCDWAKVRTEYPTPGENLVRNRVWGNYSTGEPRHPRLERAQRARRARGPFPLAGGGRRLKALRRRPSERDHTSRPGAPWATAGRRGSQGRATADVAPKDPKD
jgi:isoquinoline 1-oxidoreductase beta subunit